MQHNNITQNNKITMRARVLFSYSVPWNSHAKDLESVGLEFELRWLRSIDCGLVDFNCFVAQVLDGKLLGI